MGGISSHLSPCFQGRLPNKLPKEEHVKTTLSVIKADIGSIGGHIKPSARLIKRVAEYIGDEGRELFHDVFICHTGDDVAILFSHSRGVGNSEIHKLAWDAFLAGTEIAKEQGLYGAGQDLLKDSLSVVKKFKTQLRYRFKLDVL